MCPFSLEVSPLYSLGSHNMNSFPPEFQWNKLLFGRNYKMIDRVVAAKHGLCYV